MENNYLQNPMYDSYGYGDEMQRMYDSHDYSEQMQKMYDTQGYNEQMQKMFGQNGYGEQIQKMYPNIYKSMMPYVDDVVDSCDMSRELSEDDLNSMAYQVMKNSNISNDPPNGHNENTINDIARALIITGLFDRFDDSLDFRFFPPFFFFPFRRRFRRRRMH